MGEARRLLDRDLHRPVEELFQIARSEYIPLLTQGQAGDRQKASQVLREKIMPRYQEVRRVGDRLFTITRSTVGTDKRTAIDRAEFWGNFNIVVSLLAVTFLVLTKWAVARSIVRATDTLN